MAAASWKPWRQLYMVGQKSGGSHLGFRFIAGMNGINGLMTIEN